jgi:HEAT repeats/PBS lyase HEAT-like repeat
VELQGRDHPDGGTRPQRSALGGAVVSSLFLLVGLTGVSQCGCGLVEELTSREFTVTGMFTTPEPLHVLAEDRDGDHRQKALRMLKEPKQNGGTNEQQDAFVKILVTAAQKESQALARLAAIQTLSTYKDPRVVEGLKEAYYSPGPFPPETVTMLKCEALKGLGEVGQPAAVETLVKALEEPREIGPSEDRQHKMDERIAAARALGHYKQYQAAEALITVLRKENRADCVALRDCAHKSLVQATGKDLPPDAKAWDKLMNEKQPDPSVADQKSPVEKFIQSIVQTSGTK